MVQLDAAIASRLTTCVGDEPDMKEFSKRSAILRLCLFTLVCAAVFITLYDPAGRRRANRANIMANLHTLSAAAALYMEAHDTNEVTYADILEADILFGPMESILGEDYTTFDVNTNDTAVEIQMPDGEILSIKFNP